CAARARRVPDGTMIRIGTSGWQYKEWRGRFYPKDVPQSKWLTSYASRFSTVEVNNSFYRLPEAETFARWREQTPRGFVMAVKASRFLTHLRRLRDPQEPFELLWARAGAPGDTRRKLRRWADRIGGLPVRETWVYFNNDTGGAAPRDAETLRSMLGRRADG